MSVESRGDSRREKDKMAILSGQPPLCVARSVAAYRVGGGVMLGCEMQRQL